MGNLGLRAGIHSGPAIGGVVGTTMQRYHLFGGTMHIAEALEATAPSGAVHLSSAARRSLAEAGQPHPIYRGETLALQEVNEELFTSKGERIDREKVGGDRTFRCWPSD